MEEVRILFVSANPSGPKPLSLDEEIRLIKEKIRAAANRDLVEVITVEAARPDDIIQALNQYQPDIVHFSGHGSKAEQLIFCDQNGNPKPVSKEAMLSLFRILGTDVQVVVFNTCFSQPQAEAIAEYIPCTIGMNKAVGDRAAIIFAASFYRALAFSRSVKNAYEQGVLALQMEGVAEDKTPQLLVKSGVDAAQVIPVNPR